MVCRILLAGTTDARLARHFAVAVLVLAVSAPMSVKAQTPDPLPPLPQTLDRQSPNVELTLPPESQPNREQHRTTSTSLRQPGRLPVPGRPGRNLGPPGEPEPEEMEEGEEEEMEEEEGEEEELPPGLFMRLPHEMRDGGITVEYIYTGETFTLARGGMSGQNATNYRSNFDLVMIGDTERLGWWDGGRIFLYGQSMQGRPLSLDHVGDVQLFSNIDSTISDTERFYFTTISEFWYEHYFWDDILRVKIGKQDSNVDFALSDVGGDFVHSSFGMVPMIPMPTFPSQALGCAVFCQLSETASFGVGVYDGTLSSGTTGGRFGFDTLGHNGAMSLYQFEWKPQSGPNGQHPSTVRIGAWQHSDNTVWTELTADPAPRTFVQNYGFYTTADHMLWKESYGDDDDQGLSVFGMFGWAPGNRNMMQESYGGGMVYKGLLPGRDNDFLGFGVANVLFSSGYRDMEAVAGNTIGTNETALEFFYKISFSQYFVLQPDLQYICHPGGQYRDAVLPGVRFELVF